DQTKAHLWELMYYCRDIVSVLGLSGQTVNAQQALLRDLPDILITTPSRLVVHLDAGNVDLKHSVHTVVMDEADMILSFGYGDDVKKIFNALPKICQHFFMSATLSPELDALKKALLHNPAVVKLEEGSSDGKLTQYYLPVAKKDKDLLLYALIKLGIVHGKIIFFVNSTSAAYRLKLFFEQFLIPAAVVKSYTHRIGRTARGGANGTAISLVATNDAAETKALTRVQSKQSPVVLESQDVLSQPAPLAFDIKDIDCFRYRVEDVRRAVTGIAVREAQLNDVKKEMLNSDKLRAHFEDHPRELNLLQHDKQVGKARIQPHLGTIPAYLVPTALQAPAPSKKRKNHGGAYKKNHKRRTDNDPLHTFTHEEGGGEAGATPASKKQKARQQAEEDRIHDGNAGIGVSTSGRQKWKAARKKGHYNPKTIAKRERKARLGAKH
ncbi:hypothetical protein DYB28_014775, partial [Aphanomyces astaci]